MRVAAVGGLIVMMLFGAVAVAAQARAPETSLRPVARMPAMVATMPETAVATPAMRQAAIRPKPRPGSVRIRREPLALAPTSDDIAANTAGVIATSGAVRSPRPLLRPAEIVRRVMAKRRARRRGAVCGDVDIQGEPVGRVPGRIAGCGVKNAVRVRSVAGVALSQQAVIDCTTAKSLKNWIERGIRPAIGHEGGGLVKLRVAAHYACRTRNNRPGAKISEHGRGRAIDISGFILRDGREISVLKGWGKGSDGRKLKRIHKTACGPFGTVLGPRSDRYHRDHFHVDTARYRSGSYCR